MGDGHMLNPNDTSKTDNRQMPTFQPMGLGSILDATLSLYRNNFRLFLGVTSIYFILIVSQEGVVVFLLEISSTLWLDNVISDMDSLLDNVVYMLTVGVLVIASSDIYLGKPITSRIALRRFRYRFFTYLGSSFLYLLPFAILTLDSISGSRSMGLLTLLSLPFLYAFYIVWVFYGPVILLEKMTSAQSFGRSRDLVQGIWRRVFGIVLAILLLDFAMYYILGNSFGVVLALFGIIGDGSVMETIDDLFSLRYEDMRPTSLETLIMYIIYLAAETFTLPIYAIGVTLLYFDLCIRKEGFDIEMRVRNS